MRKPTRSEVNRANGAIGLKKRYEARMRIIERLHELSNFHPNYTKWSTENLKTLLTAWETPKK